MSAEVVAQSGPGAVKPTAAAPTLVAPTPPAGPIPAAAPSAPKLDPAEELRRERIATKRAQAKLHEELAGAKKTLGEKLSRLTEMEKREVLAKRNPEAYLKSVYGDGWYDTIVQTKLNGGVPTADMLASELDKVRSELESKYDGELAKRDAAAKEAVERTARESAEAARGDLRREAKATYAAKAAEFPLILDQFGGNADAMAAAVAEHIERHFHTTTRRDESGRVVEPGRILTVAEVLAAQEERLVAMAEKAAAHEKYGERLRGKLTPARNPGTVVKPQVSPQSATPQVQRRSLSNDLNGSTVVRNSAATPAEKRERAIAAYEAAKRNP